MSKHFGRDARLTIDGKVIGVVTHVDYELSPEATYAFEDCIKYIPIYWDKVIRKFFYIDRDESEKRQEWYDREEENGHDSATED